MIVPSLTLLLFLVAIIWLFVWFPNVSISTFESKARSLFVDEHSILINRNAVPRVDAFHKLVGTSNWTSSFEKKNNHFLQFQITPKASPKQKEAVGLIFLIPRKCMLRDQFLELIYDVSLKLERTLWLSKEVSIILSEQDVLKQKDYGENWSLDHFRVSSTLREVYIFDFSSFIDVCESPLIADIFTWKTLNLRFKGFNGNIPNLDMIAASKLMVANLYGLDVQLTFFHDNLWNLLRQCIAAPLFYMDFSCWDSTQQDGIHAFYLLHNVDSITFEIVRGDAFSHESMYLRDINKLIMGVIFQSCLLEEELHHSFFFYLLVGSQTFVGHSEYGLVCLLFLSSISLYFVAGCSHLQFKKHFFSVMVEMLLADMIVAAIVILYSNWAHLFALLLFWKIGQIVYYSTKHLVNIGDEKAKIAFNLFELIVLLVGTSVTNVELFCVSCIVFSPLLFIVLGKCFDKL